MRWACSPAPAPAPPTLQAAITTLGNNDAAVGYSVAYPFGVAGPILILYLTFMFMKPKIEQSSANMELLEIALRNPPAHRQEARRSDDALPAGVQIVALRHHHHNLAASPDIIIGEDDVVLATGPDRETLDRVRIDLGEAAPGRISEDRSDLDYIRLFASQAGGGRPPARRPRSAGRRGGRWWCTCGAATPTCCPNRDLVLETGDRVGLFASRDHFPAMRKYFGDSIKATAEFSYISIGLGMALGIIIGLVSITMPGLGKVSFGLAGVLIAALVLGKLRRTGPVNWTIPLSANLVMRNLGLTLFLAQVGMSAGPKFAATVSATGFLMLGLATVAVLALVLPVLLMGPVPVQAALRRGGRHRRRRHRQPRHPRLRQQAGPDRPAGRRLRHDLPRHDHREDLVRQHRAGAPAMNERSQQPAADAGGAEQLFGFDAFSPQEVSALVRKSGVKKAGLPLLPQVMLAILGGAFIGLGALYYVVVRSDPTSALRPGRCWAAASSASG